MPDVVSDLLGAVAAGGPVLTDGGIETRIMFETDLPMDPHVQVAGLLGDAAGEQALGAVYRGYLAAGGSAGLPVVIGTPTFRASARYTERAGLGGAAAVTRLNHAAVDFHRSLRRAAAGPPVWIAGVLGPAGDAYLLDAAPGADEAAVLTVGADVSLGQTLWAEYEVWPTELASDSDTPSELPARYHDVLALMAAETGAAVARGRTELCRGAGSESAGSRNAAGASVATTL